MLDSLIQEKQGNLSEIQATILSVPIGLENPFISIENKLLTKKQCLIHLFKKKETSVSPSKRCIFASSHQLVILVLIFNDGYVLQLRNLCFKQYFEISMEDPPKILSLHFLNLTFEFHSLALHFL